MAARSPPGKNSHVGRRFFAAGAPTTPARDELVDLMNVNSEARPECRVAARRRGWPIKQSGVSLGGPWSRAARGPSAQQPSRPNPCCRAPGRYYFGHQATDASAQAVIPAMPVEATTPPVGRQPVHCVSRFHSLHSKPALARVAVRTAPGRRASLHRREENRSSSPPCAARSLRGPATLCPPLSAKRFEVKRAGRLDGVRHVQRVPAQRANDADVFITQPVCAPRRASVVPRLRGPLESAVR